MPSSSFKLERVINLLKINVYGIKHREGYISQSLNF